MRLIILGTGPFIVPSLRALSASRHDLTMIISRPPRGHRSKPAPICMAAKELEIDVWLPDTVNSEASCGRIASLKPDLLVVCDYGEILAPAVLETARLGGINLHGSLLPKYRGAAPVQWAIIQGEAETGNSVIQMTPGLDAGPCLGKQRIAIDPNETAGALEVRLAAMGATLVLDVVEQLAEGSVEPEPQDVRLATRAPRLTKADGLIDWSQSAIQIHNRVRALQPWPRAFSHWYRESDLPLRLIIDRVEAVHDDSLAVHAEREKAAPGTVLEAGSRLVVATGDGAIELSEVQPAGKRAMTASDFLRGYRVKAGQLFASGPGLEAAK
jgi:methionyl-tRNA formyltransferase